MRELRAVRPTVRIVLALLLATLIAGLAQPAQAADERIESLDVEYAIQPDGTVRVTTTIDWNFGKLGMHGIDWAFLTREEWSGDDDKVVLSPVKDIKVSSPTGAPATFRVRTEEKKWQKWARVIVNEDGPTLDKSRHTYVIQHTQEGALRTFEGKPELHWDVTGVDLPPIEQATVKVTAPGGVTEAICHPPSGVECTVDTKDGAATFSAQAVRGILTIYAGLVPGQVANAQPILEPKPKLENNPVFRFVRSSVHSFVHSHPTPSGLILAALGVVISAWESVKLRFSERPKDKRYLNAPPGDIVDGGSVSTTPLAGVIPVRFVPPEATLVEAGMALNRRLTGSALAATIVAAVLDGAVSITTKPRSVRRKDVEKATGDASVIFSYADSASSQKRTARSAYQKMMDDLRRRGRRVLDPQPKPVVKNGPKNGITLAVIAGAVAAMLHWLDVPHLYVVLLGVFAAGLLLGCIIFWIMVPKFIVPRTALGTAIFEQTEGFRQYISKAESHQLNFEADRDIYTRYLPWAVLFGLTNRWTKFCKQLALDGKIDDPDLGSSLDDGALRDLERTSHRLDRRDRDSRRRYQEMPINTGSGSASSSGRRGSSGSGGGGVSGGSH
ncbi:DUF2207 domain-containing protein [uncultured Tessaracoccus sp.]|uniref:DUF2207 domain-containing protein n=1 Tax=uncultured Tessaracoccus sp. TaxID=905023 RepID=UPI002637292E|nr:DUF2207 domain-containing protein [uncultured Tessaracoccus sp.]